MYHQASRTVRLRQSSTNNVKSTMRCAGVRVVHTVARAFLGAKQPVTVAGCHGVGPSLRRVLTRSNCCAASARMRAVVLAEPSSSQPPEEALQFRSDVPIPAPGAGQVRVRVHATGVCHRDVLDRRGAFPFIQRPTILGHEIGAWGLLVLIVLSCCRAGINLHHTCRVALSQPGWLKPWGRVWILHAWASGLSRCTGALADHADTACGVTRPSAKTGMRHSLH